MRARNDNPVPELLRLLGQPVLLLAWPRGTKGTKRKWGRLTLAAMEDPRYLAKLAKGNIGVALGDKSGGLCSIDFDDDDALRVFDSLNPALADTLRSRASRGGNVWLRFAGSYPERTKKLMTHEDADVGEFRSTGAQTIIHGTHPSGCSYTHNGKPVIVIPFQEIHWPDCIANQPSLETRLAHTCTEETEATEVTEDTDELKSSAVCSSLDLLLTVHTVEEAVRVSLPDKARQNNSHLFKLARAVKSLEIQQGPFSTDQLLGVFSLWYQQAKARSVLRAGQTEEDYLMEFLNAYRKAKHPLGSATLARAWKRAQTSEPPPETMRFQNPQTRLLATFCRELQTETGAEPFYLSSRLAACLLGHESHTTVATWLGAFVTLGILAIAKVGDTKHATRYFFRGTGTVSQVK